MKKRWLIVTASVLLLALGIGLGLGITQHRGASGQPPVITDVLASDITQTSATITWTSDEPATSSVVAAPLCQFPQLATTYIKAITGRQDCCAESKLVENHSMALESLKPGTTYVYSVISRDRHGNETTSEVYSFTTPGTPTYYQPE
jgi:phosphodiesterase/alkaline phosphatase D-like protein